MPQTDSDAPRAEGLHGVAALLRSRTNRHALLGLGIGLSALVAATLLACRQQFDDYSWSGMVSVHQSNPALWLLDLMPLLFLVWGQYIGTMMSRQARALIVDHTSALREQTTVLQRALAHQKVQDRGLGLPDRAAFLKAVAQARAAAPGSALAVLTLITEQYAEIEHGQGPEAGRALLLQLLARLRSVIGEEDLLAHFGQDDFAVLVPHVQGEADARRYAHRIQMALDTPLQLGRQSLGLRASIGIALAPLHGEQPEQLIRRAEVAKFAAAGEQREFRVYEPALDDSRHARARRMAELHAALYHEGLGETYLLQQPQQPELPPRLRLKPYWNHPHLGRLEEEDFLALPNRLSLVHSLTLWLLREALARIALWRLRYRQDVHVVVRLPDPALSQLQLAELSLRLLRSHDLPAPILSLEFSEAALREPGAAAQLAQLHKAGIRIGLADVGAPGTSLLASLYFPVGEARLSARLLQRLLDRGQQPLAQPLLELLQAQHQDVILCDLDRPELLPFAARLPVAWLEGSAIAAPMSPEDAERWIADRRSPSPALSPT